MSHTHTATPIGQRPKQCPFCDESALKLVLDKNGREATVYRCLREDGKCICADNAVGKEESNA